MTRKTLDKRQSGRTTRMLDHAVQLAKSGRAVYVIAANKREAERLQQLLPDDLGIKVEFVTILGDYADGSVRIIGVMEAGQ